MDTDNIQQEEEVELVERRMKLMMMQEEEEEQFENRQGDLKVPQEQDVEVKKERKQQGQEEQKEEPMQHWLREQLEPWLDRVQVEAVGNGHQLATVGKEYYSWKPRKRSNESEQAAKKRGKQDKKRRHRK